MPNKDIYMNGQDTVTIELGSLLTITVHTGSAPDQSPVQIPGQISLPRGDGGGWDRLTVYSEAGILLQARLVDGG